MKGRVGTIFVTFINLNYFKISSFKNNKKENFYFVLSDQHFYFLKLFLFIFIFYFPTLQQGDQVILTCIHYNYIFPTLSSVAT